MARVHKILSNIGIDAQYYLTTPTKTITVVIQKCVLEKNLFHYMSKMEAIIDNTKHVAFGEDKRIQIQSYEHSSDTESTTINTNCIGDNNTIIV
jgi:hypothetical protein